MIVRQEGGKSWNRQSAVIGGRCPVEGETRQREAEGAEVEPSAQQEKIRPAPHQVLKIF